jgi:hypothetical protein
LTTVYLGGFVEEIGNWAFYGTALTEISLPDSVRTIGDMVFEKCTGSLKLILGPNITSVADSALGPVTNIYEIHIRSKPIATHKSICQALANAKHLFTIQMFVAGGFSEQICNISVESDPTLSAGPSQSPVRTLGETPTETATAEQFPTQSSVFPTRTRRATSLPTKTGPLPTMPTPTVSDDGSNKREKIILGVVVAFGVLMILGIVVIVVLVFLLYRSIPRGGFASVDGLESGRQPMKQSLIG